MKYDQKLKANPEIFEKLKFVNVGQAIILKPTIPELFEQEAVVYLINSKSNDVKKYLPFVYADNPEMAKEKLMNFTQRMLLKASLFYCIRLTQQPFPIGYIHLNSPISFTGINDWSVDFWLAENMTGKGIMSASLHSMLVYLQENQVPIVKALVNRDNYRSIKVLKNVGFGLLEEDAGDNRSLYAVRLR